MIEHILSYSPQITKALIETLILVGIATGFAIILGLPLGTLMYLSRENGLKPKHWIYTLSNAYVNIVRSFPFLIFIVMLFPITRLMLGRSIGTIPATFPLSLVSIALYARFVEQSLLEVPSVTINTAISMGATLKQTLRYFIYPSARQGLILGLTSTIISTISYSTVVGVVGGGGIGDFAFRYGYQSFDYPLMYAMVIIIIIFVQIIQGLGNTLSKPKHLK